MTENMQAIAVQSLCGVALISHFHPSPIPLLFLFFICFARNLIGGFLDFIISILIYDGYLLEVTSNINKRAATNWTLSTKSIVLPNKFLNCCCICGFYLSLYYRKEDFADPEKEYRIDIALLFHF